MWAISGLDIGQRSCDTFNTADGTKAFGIFNIYDHFGRFASTGAFSIFDIYGSFSKSAGSEAFRIFDITAISADFRFASNAKNTENAKFQLFGFFGRICQQWRNNLFQAEYWQGKATKLKGNFLQHVKLKHCSYITLLKVKHTLCFLTDI